MKELIINLNDANIKNIMLTNNGILVEKYEENNNTIRLEGNIYMRKSPKYITGNASSIYRHRWKKKHVYTSKRCTTQGRYCR